MIHYVTKCICSKKVGILEIQVISQVQEQETDTAPPLQIYLTSSLRNQVTVLLLPS
jgi:hypothetical protein